MEKYVEIIIKSYKDYWNYLVHEVTQPSWHSYFYWVIGVSLLFWLLEIRFPWRKRQAIIRKDFWLDGFYILFNFFLFSLIGYNALSNVVVEFFNVNLKRIGIDNLAIFNVAELNIFWQLFILFVVRDFIQYFIHRLLHRVPFLWNFHKVHHSVKQMGFAAQMRYHWMENVVYRGIQYIPLALIGFGIQDFITVYLFAFFVGHFNHANINVPLGPFKYIFNNPQMHIWHHAKALPSKYGVNFGLTLSVWDYIFGTDYIPEDGRDIPLGFSNDENFPEDFIGQNVYPLNKKD